MAVSASCLSQNATAVLTDDRTMAMMDRCTARIFCVRDEMTPTLGDGPERKKQISDADRVCVPAIHPRLKLGGMQRQNVCLCHIEYYMKYRKGYLILIKK